MTKFLSILTGLALLSQANHATAQMGAVKNKGLDQFFSSVLQSSSPVVSEGRPKTAEVKGEEHNLLLKASCEKIMKEDMRIANPMNWGAMNPMNRGAMSLMNPMSPMIRWGWSDRLTDRSGKMKLQLRGIYTQGSVLYFLFRMNNRSALDYDVEAIRFFISDPATRKNPLARSPLVRHGEIKPVYVFDSSSMVRNSMLRGYGQVTNVIVLPRFTLPYGKRLTIEMLEKNGGRHLQLQTTNSMLERARIL